MPHTVQGHPASHPSKPFRLVVLIGGNGTNLQAIINAIQDKQLAPAMVVGVISHNPRAAGLQRAVQAGIPTHVVDHTQYPERSLFEQALIKQITPWQPDLIVLAGFMRKLTATFIQSFHNRIINVHPALLPKYTGMHTHASAIAAGETQHGASVHIVTEVLDGGPILAQSCCNIDPTDTPDTLKKKVQKIEWQLLPAVIHWFAQEKLTLNALNQWQYQGEPLPPQGKKLQFNYF